MLHKRRSLTARIILIIRSHAHDGCWLANMSALRGEYVCLGTTAGVLGQKERQHTYPRHVQLLQQLLGSVLKLGFQAVSDTC